MSEIVITGASSGIGFHTALRLVRQGHRVIAIARRQNRLSELSEQASGADGELIPLAFDITASDLEQQLIPQISERMPAIDALINNAGALVHRPFAELSDADWQTLFSVNLFAPVRLIRSLLPLLSMRLSHVVNVASMGGVQGSVKFPGLAAYSSAKAALCTLTECLAEEFKEQPLRFNCVALGAVQTEMLESAFPGYQAPLSAEEFAEFLADFALNGHRFCNGKILPMALTTP